MQLWPQFAASINSNRKLWHLCQLMHKTGRFNSLSSSIRYSTDMLTHRPPLLQMPGSIEKDVNDVPKVKPEHLPQWTSPHWHTQNEDALYPLYLSWNSHRSTKTAHKKYSLPHVGNPPPPSTDGVGWQTLKESAPDPSIDLKLLSQHLTRSISQATFTCQNDQKSNHRTLPDSI